MTRAAGRRETAERTYVSARCVACHASRIISADEIPDGEMPMCKCGNLMVAEYAATNRLKAKRVGK
jgi:hypothetical protein